MAILTNAIDSIQVGIEDYESDDERRHASAIRNIYAGILLLYKEKLCHLSPAHDHELLIRRKIHPVQDDRGQVIFKGVGRTTVNVTEIRERFRGLDVTVDWERFGKLNSIRNEIEHYYTTQTPDVIKEAVSESFLLIRNFLVNELEIDPQECIGDEAWNVLLNVSEVYEAEKLACNTSLTKCNWKYGTVEDALKHLRCKDCGSALIYADDSEHEYPGIPLTCKSCGCTFSFTSVIEQCIDNYLGVEAFIAVKDGDESPYEICPECGKDTFIRAEDCCVACGYEMEYRECDMCGESLTLEEQWLDGKCSYCQHRWEKMMAE